MRYKALANKIVDDIRAEKWQQGERMPSLRKASALYDVSMTTTLNCYHYLEESGWIVSKPQSGFYVTSPMELGNAPENPQFTSEIVTIQEERQLQRRLSSEYHSSPLGISRLADELVPLEMLQRSLKRGIQRLGSGLCDYNDPRGDEVLRKALSHHFHQYGFKLPASEMVLTGGCINAVKSALEVTTKPGDAVAISSPCFSGLLALLNHMGRQIVEIPSTMEGLDLVQLEQLMKERTVAAVLLSTSHMNPQGISLSTSQKKRLAQLASEYRIPVIEDDVYIELGYSQKAPLPAKHWDKDGYILWCSSVSKSLAAGLRVGWCWPGRFFQQFLHHFNAGCLGTSPVLHRGLAEFIATGQYQRHLKKVRTRLFAHICAYRSLLIEHLPKGSAISRPDGGMVLWCQVPGLNHQDFKTGCASAGLDVRLGEVFSTRNLYHKYFRINAGWPLDAPFDENRRINDALVELCNLANQK